jgi:abequosyltransferase
MNICVEKSSTILLSITIPTYKRATFLDFSLTSIHSQINGKNLPIEVVVLDNCSPDNTNEIVEKHIKGGMQIRYIRHNENTGMDGNFISCIKHASGKYCWILGDDDPLLEGSLEKIIEVLNSGDYGLLHIKAINNTNMPPSVYTNSNKYLRNVNYWLTFISSNIFNTKVVDLVNLEEYRGTFFTIVPLYLTAAVSEKQNLILNQKVFQLGLDYGNNGGYNIFEVFVKNFNKIIKEFAQKGYYSFYTYRYIKLKILRDFLSYHITTYLINKKDSGKYNIDNAWKILCAEYRFYPQFYAEISKLYIKYVVKRFLY